MSPAHSGYLNYCQANALIQSAVLFNTHPWQSDQSSMHLSYCWGSTNDWEHILVDGKLLPIRRSLHEFLVELRLLDRPRTVWADAVCINQGDVVERNAQVALMRDIYFAAQTVLVWLGPHDAGSPQLFQSFKLIAADPAFLQTSASLGWKENILQAFKNLMSRSYWKRT